MGGRGWWRFGWLAWLAVLLAILVSAGWAAWALATHHFDAPAIAGILVLPVTVILLLPVVGWLLDLRIDLAEAAADLVTAVRKIEGKERVRLLGQDTMPIDLAFTFVPSAGRDAVGAVACGTFNDVVAYYRRLRPRRMVISGQAGAGKSVLAIELILALLEDPGEGDQVPVRVSIPSWDGSSDFARWLAIQIDDRYGVGVRRARALMAARRVLPVLDGLDELDRDAAGGRAAAVVAILNGYAPGGRPGALVLTSRTQTYETLAQQDAWLLDAARIEIQPVNPDRAAEYLLNRSKHRERWWPVCVDLVDNPDSVLAAALCTPWQLNLAFTVYEAGDPGGLLRYEQGDDPHADLLDKYVPTLIEEHAPYKPHEVVGWLRTLAVYLETNAVGRSVDGRPLSGSDVLLTDLWPLGGVNRVLYLDYFVRAICGVLVAAPFVATGFFSSVGAFERGFFALALSVVFVSGRVRAWPSARAFDLSRLHDLRRLGVLALVSVALGLGWWWWFGRRHTALVGSSAVAVLALATVFAAVIRSAPSQNTARPRAAIRASTGYGLLSGFVAGLAVAFLLAAGTELTSSALGWLVLSVVAVLATLLAAIVLTPVWRRYLILLLTTRGRLPWRLAGFLDWTVQVGAMRTAGPAYQFRQLDLQQHLTGEITTSAMNWVQRRPGIQLLFRLAAFPLIGAISIGAVGYLGAHTTLADVQGSATADVGTMFEDLNQAMMAHDEAAFLRWAAPSARPAMKLWWDNLRAIGFTSGTLALRESLDLYGLGMPVNSHGDGDVRVLAGAHNAFDPDMGLAGPIAAVGHYEVGFHQTPGAPPQITSWHPLDRAPWDQPIRLYVTRTANAEVVAYPDERALANHVLAAAQSAALYVLGLHRQYGIRSPPQSGFIVFVSTSPARRARWFNGTRPAGWDGAAVASVTLPTSPQTTLAMLSINGVETYKPGVPGGTGAQRAVLAPAGDNADTAALVGAFGQEMLAPEAVSESSLSRGSPQEWVSAGFGRFLESLYLSGSGTTIEKALQSVSKTMLTGQLPTEFAGKPDQVIRDWSDVGASVYVYIAIRYGLAEAVSSGYGVNEGFGGNTPFDNVLNLHLSSQNPNIYYDPTQVHGGWEAWLVRIHG